MTTIERSILLLWGFTLWSSGCGDGVAVEYVGTDGTDTGDPATDTATGDTATGTESDTATGTETATAEDSETTSDPVVLPYTGAKKGVVAPVSATLGASLMDPLNVGWYFNFGPTPSPGYGGTASFVPMFHDAGEVTAENLTALAASPFPDVMGFHEPENPSEAAMTVDEAIALWPQLESLGRRLGSPAPQYDPAAGWLGDFMDRAQTDGLRVDFVCIHWFTESGVVELQQVIDNVAARYGLPIWVTMFSLWDGNTVHTAEEQAAFAIDAAAMLEAHPSVERYAWFSMWEVTDSTDFETNHLYDAAGALTPVGDAWATLP